jgi:retron-type reverse transcriptase
MLGKFEDIVSLKNLLSAWEEFLRGKRVKKDVADFSAHLMDNLIILHEELLRGDYKHGGYQSFKINDPKPRDIHKATVHDRLVHHAVHRLLYPYFDKKFIFDSYSCRRGKGTHRALNRLRQFFYRASRNNTRTCWALKGDVRKFFASIDHQILLTILSEHIADQNTLNLLRNIIESFSSGAESVGLPLGNLTSQLFVNIYLNKFDQFVKHQLKVKNYIRFADDFVILSENKKYLETILGEVKNYLAEELKLELHPNKVSIKTFAAGVDFLGLINFPAYRILRTKTKRRMLAKIQKRYFDQRRGFISVESFNQSLQSYLGLLRHCHGYELSKRLLKI